MIFYFKYTQEYFFMCSVQIIPLWITFEPNLVLAVIVCEVNFNIGGIFFSSFILFISMGNCQKLNGFRLVTFQNSKFWFQNLKIHLIDSMISNLYSSFFIFENLYIYMVLSKCMYLKTKLKCNKSTHISPVVYNERP